MASAFDEVPNEENSSTGGAGAPRPGGVIELLTDPNAKLSDFGPVLRAIREGYPITAQIQQLVIDAAETLLRDGNARRRSKGAQLALYAFKHNLVLLKMGHDDLRAIEKERRDANTAGKLPGDAADLPDPSTKQPAPISLENFVNSLPKLKIVTDDKRRTG